MDFDLTAVNYGTILNNKQLNTEAIYSELPHSTVSYKDPLIIELTLRFDLTAEKLDQDDTI